MSQENVERAHRVVDAFNRRDLDALLALMDEDVEGVPPLASIEGHYHGHRATRAFEAKAVRIGRKRSPTW